MRRSPARRDSARAFFGYLFRVVDQPPFYPAFLLRQMMANRRAAGVRFGVTGVIFRANAPFAGASHSLGDRAQNHIQGSARLSRDRR